MICYNSPVIRDINSTLKVLRSVYPNTCVWQVNSKNMAVLACCTYLVTKSTPDQHWADVYDIGTLLTLHLIILQDLVNLMTDSSSERPGMRELTGEPTESRRSQQELIGLWSQWAEIEAYTRRSPIVYSMLGQRRRRLANIESTLGECLAFAVLALMKS